MADKRVIHQGVRVPGTEDERGRFKKGALITDPDELEKVLTPELYARLTEKGAIENFSEPKGAKKSEPSGDDLNSHTVAELKEMATAAGVEGYSTMNKDALVEALSK